MTTEDAIGNKPISEGADKQTVGEQPSGAVGAAQSYINAASAQVAKVGEVVRGARTAVAERTAAAKMVIGEYSETATAAAASAKRVVTEPAVVAGEVKEAVTGAIKEPRATAAKVGHGALGVVTSAYDTAKARIPLIGRAHTRVVAAKESAEESGRRLAAVVRQDIRVTRAEQFAVDAASKTLVLGLKLANWGLGIAGQQERVKQIVNRVEERAGKLLEEHARVKTAVDALETVGVFRLGERVVSDVNKKVRLSVAPAAA